MINPLMILPPAVFAGLAITFYVGMTRENPNALPSTISGNPAPALVLENLADLPPVTDEMLREPGVKLVNYWASWCAPCRVEHPTITKLAEEGVVIYGINYKDDPARAMAFLQELGDPYSAIGTDQTGRTALDWGVYGIPETFVIDGNGEVVLRFAGPVTERILAKIIRPAMAQAAANTAPEAAE